jgi:CBS domain-containing protein
MKANDVMTTDVVSVGPESSTRAVARLLAARGISAVPVIDADGAAIGMVSEGDLIARNDCDRLARRDWWLTLLADGEDLHPDFLASLREPSQAAREVMSSPVITVSPETEVAEIARLLVAHHIKRVPVIRNGRVIGIVSRADIVRALAAQTTADGASAKQGGFFAGTLTGLEDRFRRLSGRTPVRGAVAKPLPVAANEKRLNVDDFRSLVADFERQRAQHDRADQNAFAESRRHRLAQLIDQHISDPGWRELMHHAHEAAVRGEREFMLLQFPSGLCGDSGRAINSEQPGWPETLRGEAAEIYLRWEQDLKPQGFPITARVLDFPGGMPGDIGLFLDWGI